MMEETSVEMDVVEKPQRGMNVTFKDLCLTLGNRPILENVFGEVKTGEVLVVMGPSGAGKTTLMNVLAGRRRPDKGKVIANDVKMTRYQRRMVGYVEQSDTFIPTLTLFDTLKFTALLRLPSTMAYKAKMDRVEQVLEMLELQKCRNTIIGSALEKGLSGGEKKRASIACELLTNPGLLLLDEPTTGLDSNTAFNLMCNVKRFASDYRKSVIVNIHQPSSQLFYLSDRLLLLIGGKVGYFGPVNDVVRYFDVDLGLKCDAHYNPADFIMDCARSDQQTIEMMTNKADETRSRTHDEAIPDPDSETGESVHDNGIDNAAFENDEPDLKFDPTKPQSRPHDDDFLLKNVDIYYDPNLKYQSTYRMQFYVLTMRILKMYWSEVVRPLNMAAMAMLLVFLIALFFDTKLVEDNMRERFGFLYFSHVFIMFRSTIHCVTLGFKAFPVVFKERLASSYRLSALCLATFVGDLLLGCIAQLVIVLICYWTTGFRSISTFVILILCLMLFSACMTGIVTLLGTILNDYASSFLAGILSCLFGFLISGYVLTPLPDYATQGKYIAPLGYSYNAIIQAEFGRDFKVQCAQNSSLVDACQTGNVTEFDSSYFLNSNTWAVPLYGNILVLMAIPTATRTVNYILLRYWRTPFKMIRKK